MEFRFRGMNIKPAPTLPAAPAASQGQVPHLALVLNLVLAVLTLAAFLPAMDNGFVGYDDTDYVTSNFVVQRGLNWEGIVWAFTSTEAANWHPLTWLSHQLDVQLFGLNAAGHHLTSVLLHAANGLLLFLLLRTMTGALWRSFAVAALFALHPLRVESVAWVAERKDVLSALFWLLTTYAYVRWVAATAPPHRKVFFALALLGFACGLMSKPMLVTLPFTLLLLDYWPLERFRQKTFLALVIEKIPFFALTAASVVVTFLVQRRAGAVDEVMAYGYRLSNAPVAIVRYLGKLFWPQDLAFFYPHPPGQQWPLLSVLGAGAVLAGISVIAIRLWQRQPSLLMGWCWFLGTLVPVIGLVQVGQQALADRYTYIPTLGFLVALVWSVHACVATRPGFLFPAAVIATVAAGVCLALTRQQVQVWKDTASLCRQAIAVTSNNYLAHDMLGAVLDKQGKSDAALREHVAALKIKPDYADAHNNLAVALQRQGRLADAISHYELAFQLRPRYPEAHFNLGVALEEAGRLEEAGAQYSRAIELKPNYADAYYNLGVVLGRQGKLDAAVQQFQHALALNSDYAEAHNNLGVTLDRLGRPDEAVRHYEQALRLQPQSARAHFNLGVALTKTGKLADATAAFEEALRLNPDYAQARTNLAAVRAAQQ
jgi:tetratricopeptide (TPR) repeat protein